MIRPRTGTVRGVTDVSASGTPARPAPLEGLRVIDAATILAGPLCAQILGDYGADVIKVEHPKNGDSMRGHGHSKDDVPLWWTEISRNKRTVALDLKSEPGGEAFRAWSPPPTSSSRTSAPAPSSGGAWGPSQLHALNPGLVMLRVTGFGQTGPYASRPGFGTLAEAMSGFADLTGAEDGPPTLPAFGLADSICGIGASSAVMMALWHRERSGRGQVIDMNILQPIMTAVGPAPTVFHQLGIVEERHGNRSTNNAPRNTYRTSDDTWVAISTSAQRIAERVMTLVGHPEVIDEPWFRTGYGRVQHVDLLDAYVGDWIAERTRDEVLDAFTEAGAAIGAVYNAQDLVEDPHVRETGMLREVTDERLGPVLQHDVLWRMSESPGRIRFTGRELGQDTDEVLGELGFDRTEIEQMREDEVIR